jgi:hypothetical protein
MRTRVSFQEEATDSKRANHRPINNHSKKLKKMESMPFTDPLYEKCVFNLE